MRKFIINMLFAVLLALMAVVLAIGVTLTCAVRMLEPRHLTPLAEHFANRALNADVRLGRAELSFSPAFPFLHLDLDSVVVVSRAFDNLPPDERGVLPAYADTLFVLDKFRGGINLGALLSRGEIAVDKAEFYRPELNIVIAPSGKGSFEIYQSEDSVAPEDNTPLFIPPFSIGRFALVEPREIRYFNAADSTDASILLLSQAFVDGGYSPLYKIKVDGRLNSPIARTFVNLDELSFGLDGNVHWAPEYPGKLTLEDFTVAVHCLRASLSVALDFDSVLTVEKARFGLAPVPVDSLLSFMPDSLRRDKYLYKPIFFTDAEIKADAVLSRPFRPGIDSIPYAELSLVIPDCSLRYGKARLRMFALDAAVHLRGDNLDEAGIDVTRFVVAGPATELRIKAALSRLISDPSFDVSVSGKMDIRSLPPIVTDKVPGLLDGHLDMELTAKGRSSMFSKKNFHKLDVNGRLVGRGLHYISGDTAGVVAVNRAEFGFDSQHRVALAGGAGHAAALGARITIDTASVMIDGVGIDVAGLTLGAGVENATRNDTTAVVPLGGGVRIARLNVRSVADSAGLRIRGLGGRIMLQRYKGDNHNPVIKTDFKVERLAAGGKSLRILLSQAAIKMQTHKRELSPYRKVIKHFADSLRLVYPDLPQDSIYAMAIKKNRHRAGRPTGHGAMTDSELEVIDWGISSGLRRYLTGWKLDANVATGDARVFTPYFPLRNRISMLDLAISTDSVELRGVRYTAGSSEFAIKGLVSNIRRALIARKNPSPLKINIEVNSDTIDINQLADATFSGAAYAGQVRSGIARQLDLDDDDNLDHVVDVIAGEQSSDSLSLLLIPSNIDGTINVKADNVLYSDLELKDFAGKIQVYKGAVNLSGLHAASAMGAVDLSALYSAPKASDVKFGMSLRLKRFKVERFLRLVPAVDSIMPLLRDVSGIINADIAATVDIDSAMNIVMPTLDAAVNLSGDSLTIIDPDTYRTLGKWLRFRNKADNVIKHMNVELIVRDNLMQIFPFVFNIDRYRLGVLGSNDLNMNFNYHISVLKSPLPFKFGITVKGNPDKYKVRFGGARFKEGMAAETVNVVDTARVNLLQQIENVFRRGVQNSRFSRLHVGDVPKVAEEPERELSQSDSLMLIKEGILEAPPVPVPAPDAITETDKKKHGKARWLN